MSVFRKNKSVSIERVLTCGKSANFGGKLICVWKLVGWLSVNKGWLEINGNRWKMPTGCGSGSAIGSFENWERPFGH